MTAKTIYTKLSRLRQQSKQTGQVKVPASALLLRSEERRVGKECRL